ncbi:MAG: TetR/AcrR family transcriptional regulator [Acidobacteriota bacterium]
MARPALQAEEIASFRESLCDVALRLFAERGFRAATLRSLAAELGCSAATPYRYFDSKAEIFAAVRARGFDRFRGYLEARLTGCTTPAEEVREVSRAYLEYACREPHAFRIMFQLEPPESEGVSSDRESEARTWEVVYGCVRRAIESRDLAGSPNTAAHLFWASVHGIVSLHLAGKLTAGRSAEELIEPMIEALMTAHRPGGTAERKT